MSPFPKNHNADDTLIRIMAALCYMSYGIIGLIYILLNGKNNKSQFFQYHFIQAIFLGILAMLIGWTGQGLGSFIGGICGLAGGAGAGIAVTVMTAISFLALGLTIVIYIADFFGIIQSLRGKYADMPLISKVVRRSMR